jgi:dTDP-4-dehydrorhamnose reductase
MIRTLLFGSTGMLGKKVFNGLRTDGNYELYTASRNIDLNSSNHYICDLKEQDKVRNIIKEINPGIVINCSGITNLQFCEENKEYTHRVHVASTSVITKSITKDCYYLHISTDSVFDGNVGNYTEADNLHPLNYYAQSKAEGDKAALKNHQNSLILRVNIFGASSPGQNSLMEWGIKSFLKKEKIFGYDNIIFNPLYTGQLSEIILYLLSHRQYGILNVGCKEKYSKYQFLKEVQSSLAIDDNLLQRSVYTSEGQAIKRPLNTTLDLTKFSSWYDLPSIIDGIKDGIDEFKRNIKTVEK